MRLIIKYWWIYIFLCVPFSTEAQFVKADSLFSVGNYNLASLEYERVIFRSKSPDEINLALYKKGIAQKSLGRHKEAYQTLGRVNLFLKQDSLNFFTRYELALNAYLAEDYPTALSQLKQIEYFFKGDRYNGILFLHILTLNELRKWDEAKVKYEAFEKVNPTTITAKEAYKFLDKLKLKNPERAENISYFLPGVGQMYAGYFGRGLLSGVLQALCVAYGAYGLYDGYFFTGGVAGIGLFWSFYSGGARHAKYLAEKKNEEITKKHNDRLRRIITSAVNLSEKNS